MRRLAIALAISFLGIAVSVVTLTVARDDPAFSFAGASAGGVVALLGGGWALIGCGLAFWVRRPDSRFGALLAAAGYTSVELGTSRLRSRGCLPGAGRDPVCRLARLASE